MKKVYLVYHNIDKYIEKAFSTRHEAEEYVDSTNFPYQYCVEVLKIEPKKKKILTKINIDDKIIE